MKKLAVLTILSVLPFYANAEGMYVQGDWGLSRIHDSGSRQISTQQLSVGYDYGRSRTAVDYTNFSKAEYNDDIIKASLKMKSIGISGFYDFHNNSIVTPYIGARLGYTDFKISASNVSAINVYNGDIKAQGSDTVMSLGILGGAQIKLLERLKLNLGLEYHRLTNDASHVDAKVGLRFNF